MIFSHSSKAFLNVVKDLIVYRQSILSRLRKFYAENKGFVHFVVQETITRSNWFTVFGFRLMIPKFVEDVEKEEKKLEEDFTSVIKEMDMGIGDVVTSLPVSFNKNNVIAAIVNYCRRIYVFMDSVESFIDDLFSYGTFGEYSTYVLKEEPEDFPLFGNEDVIDD